MKNTRNGVGWESWKHMKVYKVNNVFDRQILGKLTITVLFMSLQIQLSSKWMVKLIMVILLTTGKRKMVHHIFFFFLEFSSQNCGKENWSKWVPIKLFSALLCTLQPWTNTKKTLRFIFYRKGIKWLKTIINNTIISLLKKHFYLYLTIHAGKTPLKVQWFVV